MAQEALDSIAREPGTRIALWNDIGGLHISEVPMVTDAADIAAIVQGQVVPDYQHFEDEGNQQTNQQPTECRRPRNVDCASVALIGGASCSKS